MGLRGTAGEVRAVGVGMGPVWVALTRGSWRLLGLGCGCLGQLAGGIWRAVSLDPIREAEARAKAVKTAETRQRKRAAAAAKKAKAAAQAVAADLDDDFDDEEPAEEEAPAVVLSAKAEAAIRTAAARPVWEALALLGLGGAVATVGTAVLIRVTAGPASDWAGQVWESWAGLITSGALAAWTTGALAVGPSLAEAETIRAARRAARAAKRNGAQPAEEQPAEEQPAEDDDEPGEDEESDPPVDRGTALLLHVIGALAEAEAAGRAGVHLEVVLTSAVAAGLLAEGTEQGALRTWVEGCGLPTADKLGMRIAGRPVTRVGLRIDAATAALGMSPQNLLRARPEAPARPLGETLAEASAAPARAVGKGPAEAASATPAGAPAKASVPASAEAPDPAALRLILGGGEDPQRTPSPALAQGLAQEAR